MQPTATGLPSLSHPDGAARFATRWNDLEQLDAALRNGQPLGKAASDAVNFYDEANEEQFHRVERRFGQFSRTIGLPVQADPERIEASFDKGVLTVRIPKSEKAKPRKITIKAGA